MIEKTDARYKAMAEVFTMYREYGQPKTDDDWSKLIGECHKVIENSKGTKGYTLAIQVCLALLNVAEKEFKYGETDY